MTDNIEHDNLADNPAIGVELLLRVSKYRFRKY